MLKGDAPGLKEKRQGGYGGAIFLLIANSGSEVPCLRRNLKRAGREMGAGHS